MAEYVNKDAALPRMEALVGAVLDFLGIDSLDSENEEAELRNIVCELHDAIPAADVRPEKHGVWAFEAPNAIGFFPVKCSCCGTKIATTASPCDWCDEPNHIYCGNCGAKMDGKDIDK